MKRANHWLGVLGLIAMAAFAQSAWAATCTAKTGGPYNWGSASSWTGCNNKTPRDGDTVIIPSGSTVTLNVDTNQLASLTVQAGGVLQGDNRGGQNLLDLSGGPGNLTNNGTITLTDNALQIAGNFVNNGSFAAGASQTQFVGNGTQTIGGTNPITFADLDLSNPTAITLGANVTVAGQLTAPQALTSTCPTDYTLTSNNGATVQHSCPTALSCTPPSNTPAGVTVTCQCDNFARSTLNPSTIFGSNWIVSTNDTTGIVPSIVNPGYLRLTNNTGNNAKAATVPGIFPASGNYISVEFKQYAYNGSGADGMAVTLSDYAIPAVPGGFGGSLGYAQAQTKGSNGFAGGWIGVALDEYGNYQNPADGPKIGGPGFIPESVGVRGSGSGMNGYNFLAGTNGLTPLVDNRGSTTPSLGNYYQVIVDARNEPVSTSITVNRDTTGTGNSYNQNLINIPNVYSAATGQGFTQSPVPTNWQISFTGSTGGSTNIHEIGGLRICAQSMAAPSGGTAGSFNAIDEAYGTPPLAVQNYLTGHIYTKLVGTPFKFDVAALSNSQILTTYAAAASKTVTVKLVDNSDSLTVPANDCTRSCTSVCTGKPAVAGGTQTLTFASGATDKGQKQSPNFTINSAYQKLVAIISDGTTAACSTDSFSVRPLSIASVVSSNATNTGTGGTPIFKAGSDLFALTATTGATGTPGYIGTPKINAASVQAFAFSPAMVTTGVLAGNFAAAVSGVATGNNFTYSEVGAFNLLGPDSTLTPPRIPGVYDDTWTAVDSGANNDCVSGTTAAAYSNVINAGKYGCNFGITANTGAFGRFVPDHFDTAVVATATTPMPCPTGLTCPVLYNGFVYSGQPFTTQVTARNLAGAVTLNYDSAKTLSKTATLTAWNLPGGSGANPGGGTMPPPPNTVSSTAFNLGIATTNTPFYTYTAPPVLPTDIYVRATDSDSVTSQRVSGSVEGGLKVVSGRIKMANANGSELLPLSINMTAQYWAASGWVTSTTDSMTNFVVATPPATGAVSFGNYQKNLTAVSVVGSPKAIALSSGMGAFNLAAPGAGKNGSVDMTITALTGASCYVAPTPLGCYLPSNAARATFGVYTGANAFIYMREAY